MRKIVFSIIIFLIFVFLAIYFARPYYLKMKHEKIAQLTRGAKLTDLIESPDGKWIAFVAKSSYIVPSNCFYFAGKGDHTDEIWMVNTENVTKKLIVYPTFNCDDVSKDTIDPHYLRFSPDSKTLYFETSAWVTAGAVHAIDADGENERFVIDGDELRVVQDGKHKGDLIVNQHSYRFKGDTPLGSYNADFLYTPSGKKIKIFPNTVVY